MRDEIRETVKKNLEKSIENMEKNTTDLEKLNQETIMSETMSPYTCPKETGFSRYQRIAICCYQ